MKLRRQRRCVFRPSRAAAHPKDYLTSDKDRRPCITATDCRTSEIPTRKDLRLQQEAERGPTLEATPQQLNSLT